jgi:hypothetical protein
VEEKPFGISLPARYSIKEPPRMIQNGHKPNGIGNAETEAATASEYSRGMLCCSTPLERFVPA